MFFVSTAAQAFEIIYFEGYEQCAVNYITIGGKPEIYFFQEGTIDEVLKWYQSVVGAPAMPPYYALGMY